MTVAAPFSSASARPAEAVSGAAVPVATPAPAVMLDRLCLRLGGRTVLSDVSLRFDRDEFVGVLGPNGAGKTTLFRAILGLVKPAAGGIEVFGRPARRGQPSIGYMPQLRVLPAANLSGRATVASGLDGARWGVRWRDRGARAEVDRVLELVGAEALADRRLHEMSGGERQRLLLAQALLGQPSLLLLDEPLISLDPSRQDGVVALVRRLQRDLRLCVLFSAHELNPLLGAMDRVLYLGGGHAALGTVAEVVTGPSLSRLYGSPIDVVRLGERIFVMSGSREVGIDPHGPCAPGPGMPGSGSPDPRPAATGAAAARPR
ncbi:metal ABC transporter ATP-binding protein [Rhizosaccharibacter radicis]|uniref:ATP-binding cassette domain-containing protein n=1 Tax=Rhizosaccharibacter radicis TaxID=2782605 RepID=A0ABT1VSW6_9PROT|nr:ATP-binding cassette domain-containing protein [Acetobacteraceae bacterium KSS12]